jgi:hypothetical protein
MDDTIVVLRYTDLGQAERALQELKRLDRSGRLRVSAAALVGRAEQDRVGVPAGAGDADGYFTPRGGIVGMLVDAVSGPVGAVYERPTEAFHGHGHRAAHESERELLLEDVRRNLDPGITLVIAEIADPDPTVLDSALEGLGGSVTRRAARDVYAEVKTAGGVNSRRR